MTHEPFEAAARYWEDRKQSAMPQEALKKLESPMNLICVTPTEIQALFSDFKKDGYSSRQTLTFHGTV